MTAHAKQGFSMIELMVTIAILAILLALGFPSFQQWLSNTRIRNAAESIQNGLRLARNEATQRGANVQFYMPAAGAADWTVCQLAPASTAPTTCATNVIQAFPSAGGAGNVQVTTTNAVTAYGTPVTGTGGSVVFNSLGRAASANSLVRIDAASTTTGTRRLVVTISPGGMVKMCDSGLQYTTATPQGCQ